jgi:hypothetical protein
MEFTLLEIAFLCFSPLLAVVGVGICEDLVRGKKQ